MSDDYSDGLIITCDQPAVQLAFFKALEMVPSMPMCVGFHEGDDMDIKGGFVIERYTGKGGSAYLHYVGFHDGWFTRKIIMWLTNYMWNTLDCRTVFGEVKAQDMFVRSLDERLGFRQIAVLPDLYPHDDGVLYALRREECKWYKLLQRRQQAREA